MVVPRKQRWFYEGNPSLRGQLWYTERKLLYTTVRRCRPLSCFEIGTWKGGGSTLFIAQALCDNGAGELHTIETDMELHREAVQNFERYLHWLKPYVVLHHGEYQKVYPPILERTGKIDFLFLDGAEDAGETLRQYRFFLPYVKRGSLLMAHDWFTAKCALIKKEILESREWEILSILRPPKSLGLLLAVRRGS